MKVIPEDWCGVRKISIPEDDEIVYIEYKKDCDNCATIKFLDNDHYFCLGKCCYKKKSNIKG